MNIRMLLLASLLWMLAACVQSHNIPQTNVDSVSGWSEQITATAAESWRYAQMASNAYRSDLTGPRPYDLAQDIHVLETRDNDELGFAYVVFERRQADRRELIIAFRGTENDTFRDWFHGNLLGRQNPEALKIFDEWRRKHSDLPIILTGHSLGGGLAIHVSLNRPDASAFVFNTSPRFWRRGDRYDNRRVSIVEYGEALKVPRIFGREADQLYTSIGCSSGNPIAQHAMRRLATCLTQIAAWKWRDAKQSLRANRLPLPNGMPED